MSRLQTQSDMVLQHLREEGPLTQEEAKSRYGIARLASRISDLKKIHPEISRRMVKVHTRYDEMASVAEYFIEKKVLEPGELLDVKPARRW